MQTASGGSGLNMESMFAGKTGAAIACLLQKIQNKQSKLLSRFRRAGKRLFLSRAVGWNVTAKKMNFRVVKSYSTQCRAWWS